MAFEGVTLMMMMLAVMLVNGEVVATQHTVGRTAGWTIPAVGNVNYSTWATGFTFSVGDVLVFKYDATLHDVLQVIEGDYNNCDASKPEAKYSDGDSSITLDKVGSWFFICGVPGHCLAGQKLQVEVRLSMPPSMAPSSNAYFGTPSLAPFPSSTFASPSPPPQNIMNSPTPTTSPPIIAPFPTPSSRSKAPTTPHYSSRAPQHSFKNMLLVILVFASWLSYGNFL